MLTDLLRLQTRAQHERLEQLNELPATRAEYLAQLARYYGFVAPWEEAVARLLPSSDPIRQGREKRAWLELDLQFFGVDAEERRALPRAEALPPTETREQILGAAYVMEGSTLGGQIIAQHLERTLGLRGGEGYRYFRSYGPEVRRRWDEFRVELLRVSSPENDAAILHAARQTFDSLQGWFAAQKAVLA